MKLKESLENALQFQLKQNSIDKVVYSFDLGQSFDLDLRVEVIFKERLKNQGFTVDFFTYGEDFYLTYKRQASFAIFGTIVQILNDFLKNNDVRFLVAMGNSKKKGDIYEKLFKRFANGWEIKRTSNTIFAKKIDDYGFKRVIKQPSRVFKKGGVS